MKVAIFGPSGLPVSHVHRHGCLDTNRAPYFGMEEPWVIEVASIEEIVLKNYPPDEFDYHPRDWRDYAGEDAIKVFPCVALPEEREFQCEHGRPSGSYCSECDDEVPQRTEHGG